MKAILILTATVDWTDPTTAISAVIAAIAASLAALFAALTWKAQRRQGEVMGDQLKLEQERKRDRIRATSPYFELPWVDGTYRLIDSGAVIAKDQVLGAGSMGLGPGFEAKLGLASQSDQVKCYAIFKNILPQNDPRNVDARFLDAPPGCELVGARLQKVWCTADNVNDHPRLWALEFHARAEDLLAKSETKLALIFQNCDGTPVELRYRYRLDDTLECLDS